MMTDQSRERLSDTFRKHAEEGGLIQKDMHIVLGLSGGPDSLALTHLLQHSGIFGTPEESACHIHIVHVNHGLRGAASDADEAFVKRYCEEHALDAVFIRIDCKKLAEDRGETQEEAGRHARYDAFLTRAQTLAAATTGLDTDETAASRKRRIRIATAHHADDQVETILMHILRGSGTDGLAGMEKARELKDGFILIRPLLDFSKAELLDYCESAGLAPRTDQTNLDPSYSRNWVRLKLLPELEAYNPKVRDALLRLSAIARADADYLNRKAQEAYGELQSRLQGAPRGRLPVRETAEMADALRLRVLRIAAAEAGADRDVGAGHISEVDRLLRSGDPSASVDLPHGGVAMRRYDELCFFGNRLSQEDDMTGNQRDIRVTTCRMDEVPDGLEKGSFAVLDLDLLKEVYGKDAASKISVRTRRPGDWMAIRGGRKKLQDVFVDDKVPRRERDRLGFVAIEGEVLVLPEGTLGKQKLRCSPSYFVNTTTKRIVLVEITCMV